MSCYSKLEDLVFPRSVPHFQGDTIKNKTRQRKTESKQTKSDSSHACPVAESYEIKLKRNGVSSATLTIPNSHKADGLLENTLSNYVD